MTSFSPDDKLHKFSQSDFSQVCDTNYQLTASLLATHTDCDDNDVAIGEDSDHHHQRDKHQHQQQGAQSLARDFDAQADTKTYLQQLRKLSQSSSQVSTSFATTTNTPSGSRRSSSVVQLFNSCSPSNIRNTNRLLRLQQQQQQQQRQASGKIASGLSHPNIRAPSLASSQRRISQSMLALDDSVRSDKFQLNWRNLTFKYQASWPNRCAQKLRTTFDCLDGICFSSRTHSNRQQQRQQQEKFVLNNISGSFESNQLIAVIGPSGCGKTTLLQFLAGNIEHQRDKLTLVGLNEPKVAVIGQDDCLLPGLTAKETLIYASRLQNNRPDFDHQQHVWPILSELGLSECANRSVTKLSGGQAKRVTIAQELLYPTNLLILDEVTSGLDASTSYSIVKLMKYLVSGGEYPMSIVMSIHQPSAKLFSVFDRVYVMSEGSCLYEGSCEIGQINAYLARFGLECPKWNNIADYLIEMACDESGDQVRNQMIQYQCKLAHANANAKAKDNNTNQDDGMQEHDKRKQQATQQPFGANQQQQQRHQPQDAEPPTASCKLYESIERARRKRPRPFLGQFVVHLNRSLLRIRRSYILTYLQLITYIALGLQLATFYGPEIGLLSGCPRLPNNLASLVLASSSPASSAEADQQADEISQEMRRIQENMNFLLVTVMTATFAALEITVITFPLEAKTVKREWRNGWYQVSSYFMGRTLADLPFQLAFVVLFCLIIYQITGQIGLDSWRFATFVSVIVLVALIAQSFGFIFGALFMDNLPAAVFTAPLCIFPALLFSGFFSRVSQIPWFYKPLTYFSHFRYAFDAILVTLYGYGRCECDQEALTNYHSNVGNQTSSMREMFRLLFGSSDCPEAAAAASERSEIFATANSDHNPARPTGPLIDQQDFNAIQGSSLGNASIGHTLAKQHQADLSAAKLSASSGSRLPIMRSLEDALVDSIFARINSTSTPPTLSIHDSQLINGTTLSNSSSLMATLISGGDLDNPAGLAVATTTTGEPPAVVDFGQGITDHLAQMFSSKVSAMLEKQSNFGHPIPGECQHFNSYLMNEFNLHNDDLIYSLVMLIIIALMTRLICYGILTFTIGTRAS